MKYVNGVKIFESGDEVIVDKDLSGTNAADFLEKIKEVLVVDEHYDDDGLNTYFCKYKNSDKFVTIESEDGKTSKFPFVTADLVDYKSLDDEPRYLILDKFKNSIGKPYTVLKDAILKTIELRKDLESNYEKEEDDALTITPSFYVVDIRDIEDVDNARYFALSNSEMRFSRPVRFQIVANTGETIGLPLEKIDVALEYVDELKVNKKFLQETCPDSDISEITSFFICETKNY